MNSNHSDMIRYHVILNLFQKNNIFCVRVCVAIRSQAESEKWNAKNKNLV